MKILTVRSVPDEVHRLLKTRAGEQGRSMSHLALSALVESLDRPTRGELLERIASRGPTLIERPAAELVRDERYSQ